MTCLHPMNAPGYSYKLGCRCERCKAAKSKQQTPYRPRPRKPPPLLVDEGRYAISILRGFDPGKTPTASIANQPIIYLVHDSDYCHRTLACFDEDTGNTVQRKAAAESLVRALERGFTHDPTRCRRGHTRRKRNTIARSGEHGSHCYRCQLIATRQWRARRERRSAA